MQIEGVLFSESFLPFRPESPANGEVVQGDDIEERYSFRGKRISDSKRQVDSEALIQDEISRANGPRSST